MSQTGLHGPRPDAVPARKASDAAPMASRAVLLVEDDASIVSSLGEALEEEGMDVASAENGRDALELLRNGLRPSAIVLDLMMPVMDGWDFRSEQLRDPELRDIPVVVITATGFTPGTIRMQLGDVAVLPKPVPYLDLLELLSRARGAPTA